MEWPKLGSLLLTGLFRFKGNSQFVDEYPSVVTCALEMHDLISKKKYIFNNK
jgi:hypothetical protein